MPAIELEPGGLSWASEGPADVSAWPVPDLGSDGLWEAWIGLRDGTKIIQLDISNIGKIIKRRNTWDTLDFSIPKTDLMALAACKRWVREVQVYRDGILQFVGPIVAYKGSGSDGSRKFGACGLLVYLNKRVRANAELDFFNRFYNPQFDDGFKYWLNNGGTFDEGFNEAGRDRSVILGDGDTLGQTVYMGNYDFDYSVQVACRVWIDEEVTPSIELPLIVVNCPGVSLTPEYSYATISENTPRGTWTTVAAYIKVDGFTQPFSTFQCYFVGQPGGNVRIGLCSFAILGIPTSIIDPSEYARQYDSVEMATDIANTIQSVNSDLNLGVSITPVGAYVSSKIETVKAWDRIRTHLATGLIEVDTQHTQYTRYVLAGARLGRDIPSSELVIKVGEDGNADDYDYDDNATNARNSIYAISQDGLVGQALDSDSYDGFLLEDIISVPQGIDTQELRNAYANYELKLGDGRDVALVVKQVAGGLVNFVKKGDRATVQIEDNDIVLYEVKRVLDIEIDPNNDTFDIVFNYEEAVGS